MDFIVYTKPVPMVAPKIMTYYCDILENSTRGSLDAGEANVQINEYGEFMIDVIYKSENASNNSEAIEKLMVDKCLVRAKFAFGGSFSSRKKSNENT